MILLESLYTQRHSFPSFAAASRQVRLLIKHNVDAALRVLLVIVKMLCCPAFFFLIFFPDSA